MMKGRVCVQGLFARVFYDMVLIFQPVVFISLTAEECNNESSKEMSIVFFRVMKPCTLAGGYKRFRRTYRTHLHCTGRHNPEDHNRHFHRRENLKSQACVARSYKGTPTSDKKMAVFWDVVPFVLVEVYRC
jgi:hypothetical protein